VSASQADIGKLIDQHLAELARPGVLSARPGYQVSGGWLTGRQAVVVTVARKTPSPAGGLLPASLDGVPVDVRQASPRKHQALTRPGSEPEAAGLDPASGALPVFPGERTLSGEPVPAQRPAAAVLAAASKPELLYAGPDGVPLTEVSGHAVIQACASPDAGWPVLKAFLAGVTQSLTIGLYDFTSRHILDWVSEQLPGKTVRLVLDHPARNPTADQTDEQTVAGLEQALGQDLSQAWALARMDPLASAWIFPTSYHIKVAVADHSRVWLSSGNWNNSNQPDIDPVANPADADAARDRDRDWHVVIDQPRLAAVFEAFLGNDFTVAASHNQVTPAAAQQRSAQAALAPAMILAQPRTPPFAQFRPPLTVAGSIRIIPLLTPDKGSYARHIKALIDSAETSLYLQFQYIELPKAASAATAAFAALVDAVIGRQQAGVDVRIIMSEYETAGYLEQLQAAGLDVVNGVRIQDNVHNKGIVVDARTVVVSSQNWSGDGTLYNRDAGVVIHSPRLAGYFQQIFLHDWDHLARAQAASD
jgi:phosphatidylserine/phosphatidylglycerophosphate/cardiolipin synthase-like enzyme